MILISIVCRWVVGDETDGELQLRLHWRALDESQTGGLVEVGEQEEIYRSLRKAALRRLGGRVEEAHFVTRVLNHVNKRGHFEVIHKVNLWEMWLLVLVRKADVPYISGVQSNSIKTQLGGLSGYKGYDKFVALDSLHLLICLSAHSALNRSACYVMLF